MLSQKPQIQTRIPKPTALRQGILGILQKKKGLKYTQSYQKSKETIQKNLGSRFDLMSHKNLLGALKYAAFEDTTFPNNNLYK